jgi:acylphosphatase
MDTLHLELSGRVQGVGFRWFVVEKARQLKLAGWVKNRPDVNVEIAAAGTKEALVALESAARQGPRGSRIDGVQVLSPMSPDDLPQPFAIER